MTTEELAAAIDSLNISSEQLKSYIAESGAAINVRPDYPDTIETGIVEITNKNAVTLTTCNLPARVLIRALQGDISVGNHDLDPAHGYVLPAGQSLDFYLQDPSILKVAGETGSQVSYLLVYQSKTESK